MRVSDVIKHELSLLAVKESIKAHEKKREIDLERDTTTREKRTLALIKHEEINRENQVARDKESENHLAFLKMNTLKVI
jgi:hypothetical protein